MRHALTALVVLLLSVTPARAAEGRVVLDATLLVMSGETVQMCLNLEPGTLAVTSRLVQAGNEGVIEGRPVTADVPVDVTVYRYRGAQDSPGVHTTATQAEATYITPIGEGLHCLALENRAVSSAPHQQRGFSAQFVAVRMTIEPS